MGKVCTIPEPQLMKTITSYGGVEVGKTYRNKYSGRTSKVLGFYDERGVIYIKTTFLFQKRQTTVLESFEESSLGRLWKKHWTLADNQKGK